ncbi:methionine ABC transporter ATP-binding protein [Candidatus Pantoea deserta]|uniref:methionine ABC transporter ATP-binding protein n=1 Tax=Candidatus Pantoea deserta TaxID=1869313 RepID=UPI0018F4687E|nr:ATP-binding cassette domain-containing protein [Pantoea deserta]
MADKHIEVINVSKHFKTDSGQATALDNVSFEVNRGDIFGIIGQSGAGKSTLLRTLNKLEDVSFGRVFVDNIDIASIDYASLLNLRKKIGMIFQHFNLFSSRSVVANVEFPLISSGYKRSEARKTALALLERVGLQEKAFDKPSKLSGGQKQRVGIARALAHNPEILLCDEATSALDPETTHSILSLLKEINKELGITIILITHDMGVIKKICNRLVVLSKGKIVETGSTHEIFSNPKAEETQRLLSPLSLDGISSLNGYFESKPTHQKYKKILKLSFPGKTLSQGIPISVLYLLGKESEIIKSNIEQYESFILGNIIAVTPQHLDLEVLRLNPVIKDYNVNIEVMGYVSDHAG